MLKFLGSGSGFADEHTSAYFVTSENELVVIDCPVSAVQKLKNRPLLEYEDIYVLITHTHGDHIGGLGLFAQYAYFVLKTCITIVAPSDEVAKDIETVLQIEGNDFSWYDLLTVSDLEGKDWFGKAILTEHSPQLKGKCFGYQMCVDGKNCVYTGDTSTLEPFMPYIKAGTQLYVDVSAHYGIIHLKLEDAIPIFKEFIKNGVEIYLMHLDDAWKAYKILEVSDVHSRNIAVLCSADCE
jgi:ribonuclease BN (tRNA processing enzyme)